VVDRDGELEDPSARLDLMTALAEATGGEVLSGTGPDPAGMAVRSNPSVFSSESQAKPLWDTAWLLLLIGLPLGLEWALRRRLGLP
jgi:hypothetical protein